ncbi:MAG: DUF4946 domain-containing protein [Rudaea sp.]
MKRNIRLALVCSIVATTIALAGLRYAVGFGSTPVAEVFGRLIGMAIIVGITCGWLAGRAGQSWSWQKFAVLYVLFYAIALFVSAHGHGAPRSKDVGDASAYSVTWPQGWTVQRLEGASSAESDRTIGSRERGLLGAATAPRAVIEVTCMHKPPEEIDNADLIKSVADDVVKRYGEQGFAVSVTTPTSVRVGAYAGMMAEIDATHDGADLRQSLSVAQNDRCLLTVTLTAKKADYPANLAAYAAVRDSIR